MKKLKSQKGITLIALIITIIVLLILAVVAIGAVQNDGIINHAKNARDEYGKAQVNENTTLENYLEKIKENLPQNENKEETPPSGEDDSGTTNTNTITFTIANDTFTAAAGMTWEQWINSPDYDSWSWKIYNGLIYNESNYFMPVCVAYNKDEMVSLNEEIVDGKEYVTKTVIE